MNTGFGTRLRAARLAARLTQLEAVSKMKKYPVSRHQLALAETDRWMPLDETMAEIAAAVGVTKEYLTGG